MNKLLRLVLVTAAIVVFSPRGVLPQMTSADFTYVFPRIEAPGLQLVVSNISTVDTVVQATFFSPGGSVARSLRFTVGAGTQTIVDDSIASLGNFLGAAIVESATPLSVTATINRAGILDTVVPASSGSDLIIPFARAGSNADTTISIFNNGTQDADVLLVLGKSNGTFVSGAQITVAAKGSQHLSLNTLPVVRSDLDAATYVVVRSLGSVLLPARPVSAVGTVTNFDTGNGVVRQDVGIVQGATTDSLGAATVVPVFIAGFGYFTQIQLVNASDAAQAITLTTRGADGAAIPTGSNPVTVSVPAHGTFSRDVRGIFNFADETVGFVSISGGERLTAVGVLGGEKSPNLVVIGPAGRAVFAFAFQYRSLSRDFFSGLSFLNLGSLDSDVSLTFVTSQGFTVSQTQITVPAGNQVTKTLADLLPEAEGSGFIFVTSTSPIQAAAIEGSTDGSVLSPLPPSVVSTGFNPRPQDRFLAVGKARVAGDAIPGATVRLTGPVSAIRTTDAVGAFVFPDLPPGEYTVTIQLLGVSFEPSSVSFNITDQNQRDIDFEGTIASSTLTSVTPPSVLVGSASIQIRVKGGPFIPTSEIVFDGAVISTTFVDESTLTGAISASSLRLAREVSVQVRNRVGLTFSPSQALTFVIGNPAPVITSIEGVPSQMIAGYPGFTVTVNGTGFSEGGTVQFAGVSRAYVFDSPTRVRAFIGPEDLAVGRVAALTAMNPSPTIGPSNARDVTVYNPVAGLLSISPSITEIKIEPNSRGLQLVANGFLFKPGATVQVAGFPALSTTYLSSTVLTADIPPQALETGGIFPVTVSNPAPNLGSSEVQPLIIQNLIPQLMNIDTGPLTFSPGITEKETKPVAAIAVLHGSNFGKAYVAVMIGPSDPWPSCNQKEPLNVPSQQISSTELVLTLSIKCRGSFSIYVSSPQDQPGGGTSEIRSFTVNAPTSGPAPALLAPLVPVSTPVGAAFTLTINGSNFLPGVVVNFGTAILTPNAGDVTSTSIRIQIPAYYVSEKGIIPVTVTNPGTGGTSTRLLFSVN